MDFGRTSHFDGPNTRRFGFVALIVSMVATAIPIAPAGAAAAATGAVSILNDGTPTFDATDMGGNDSSQHNGIVRTFDLVTYEMTIANSGLGNAIDNTTIRSTLPVGMAWASLDPTCRIATAIPAPVPVSSISADRRTIVCNIGTRTAGSLVKVPLNAYPLGTVPDGTTKSASFSLEFNDPGLANARIIQAAGSADILVSAGKPVDFSHNDNVAPVLGQQYVSQTGVGAVPSNISGTVTDLGSPVAGATVSLFDNAGNPLIDSATGLPYAAVTDAAGNYSFTSIAAGTVKIQVTSGAPAGKVTQGTSVIVATVQGQPIDADFAYVAPFVGSGSATISGTLFSDVNRNTTQDAGDLGIDSVTLTLTGFDSSGNPVSQTVDTDASGNYSFTVPASGPAGYTIVPSGRKLPYYLPVISKNYTVNVGAGQALDLDVPWNLDIDLGKAVVSRLPIAIKAPSGGKGVSSLSGPISWTETVPAGATPLGCGRNGQGFNFNPLPGGIGGGTNNVVNSGTWTCTQPGGPGTPITITVNGADTSGTTFPTKSWNGVATLPVNDRYLVTGWIGVARPDPGCGVSLPTMTVTAGNFSATDAGGNPVGDAVASTNDSIVAPLSPGRACPTLPGITGYQGFEKLFTKDEAHAWAATSGGSPISNLHNSFGNALVPATLPFGSYIQTYNNSALWDSRDVIVCDALDLTRFKLYNRPGVSPATPFALTITNPQTPFQNRLLNQYGDSAMYDAASTTSGAYIVEIGIGAPWATLAIQRAASCTSPLTWIAWDPAAAMNQSDLDQAVMFRVRAKAMQPGDQILLRAEMIGQATPATAPYAGVGILPSANPDPTYANSVSYSVNYNGTTTAGPRYTRFADPATGIVRVNKFDPNVSGGLSNAVLGDIVPQRIDVSANGVFPSVGLVMRDVQVVDTIPAGTTYVPGSANITPVSIVPGAGGTSVITWMLGALPTDSVTTTINYQVSVADDLPTGTTLTNTAVVSSLDDPSPAANRTDIHQIAVTAPQEFKIFKTVPDIAVEPEDRFSYVLGYKNLSTTPLASQDFIDVLPYVGDGRSTSYTGVYTFDTNVAVPIVPEFADDALYLTLDAPGSINRDPAAASNAVPYAGSGTKWCLVPTDVGSPGCPTTMHDPAISAFRVVSTHSMSNTDPSRHITTYFRGTGDAVGNVFRNNMSAAATGLATWVQSSAVQVTVSRSSISNVVWSDLNHNGRQDAGEPGIPNVTVTLKGKDFVWNGTSYVLRNNYDTTPLTAITDLNGRYSFNDLNHGEFQLSVPLTATVAGDVLNLTSKDAAADTLDSDADPTTGSTARFCLGEAPDTTSSVLCPNFTGLNSAQDNWDFGYSGVGDLGDLVFEDANGNGQKDVTESGLSGWTVNLLGPGPDGVFGSGDEVVLDTQPTDASGLYRFIDLDSGAYQIEVVPPSGWTSTSANVGSDTTDSDLIPATHRMDVVVRTGRDTQSENLSYDAGFYRVVGISDYVWVDEVADGVQGAGEVGLNGVRVDLLTSTGAVVLNSYGQPRYTITGDNPNVAGTQLGYYEFKDLAPGSYRVMFTKPFGYAFTTPGAHTGVNQAGTATDSDPDRNGRANIVVLSGNGMITDVDAGLFKPVSIGDKVWSDVDGDGVQDPGELGLAGVTVRLLDEANAPVLNSSGVAYVVTTDSAGKYEFTDLFPRSSLDLTRYYRVQFHLPAGYKWSGPSPITAPDQTSVPTSGAQLTDSDATWTTRTQATARSGKIYLSSGESNPHIDAGMYRPARVGNFVWADDDGDGIQGAAETGLAGVTVTLLVRTNLGPDGIAGTADDVYATAVDDDGAAVIPVTTASSGAYQFTNLPIGTYKLEYTWPASMHVTVSPADVSGNAIDDVDSDATLTSAVRTARTAPLALIYGSDNVDVDQGFTPVTSLGDLIFEDFNGNGTRDAGDTGVSGAEVTLWKAGPNGSFGDADDIQVTTDVNNEVFGTAGTLTTGSSGAYIFTDLAPATYQVRVKTPSSAWKPTTRLNPASALTSGTDSDLGPLGADGRTAAMTPVILSASANVTSADGGLVRSISIGDLVFTDTDGSGTQNGTEAGIAGATLTLWTAGPNGTFGDGDDVAVTADRDGNTFGTAGALTTGASGAYAFSNLYPGVYQVRVTTPSGTVLTTSNVGSDDAIDSDAVRITSTTGATGAITASSGDAISSTDIGVYKVASIGDRVWVDTNGDGLQSALEPGLANATVTLLDGSGNPVLLDDSGAAISPIVTPSSGAYSFTNLAPGTYSVKVELPAGYLFTAKGVGSNGAVDSDITPSTNTSSNIDITTGQAVTSIDAGAHRPVSVGNFVWDDTDADGVQDASETTGIPGVSIDLLNASNTVIAQTTTDATGHYVFSRLGSNQADSAAALLPPGTYTFRFHRPSGYLATTSSGTDLAVANDSDVAFTSISAATGNSAAVLINENVTELDLDAGFFKVASIGDIVWEDTNGDGIQNGSESGLAGITLKLVDSSGSAAVDVNGDPVSDITTGASGAYLFENLRPGTYKVIATFNTATTAVSTRDLGGNDALDSDFSSAGGSGDITVVSGQALTSLDLGMYRYATLGNFVFEDLNGDGIQGADERGLANIGVTLTGVQGDGTNVTRLVMTDASGHYAFRNLAPGTYHVTVAVPATWGVSPINRGGNAADDSDISSVTYSSVDTVLISGETDRTWDAGLIQAPFISGYIYVDTDNDGVRDSGELGLAGQVVELDGFDIDGNHVHLTATTDATGMYVFAGVPTSDPIGYTLTQVAEPVGYFDGKDTAGTVGGVVSSNDTLSGIVVSSGTTGSGYNFGAIQPASISGTVWTEVTGNGVPDAGESRLEGVTVTLTGTNDLNEVVTMTTTTDASGAYMFPGLRPGTYTVTETQPAGATDSADTAGTAGGVLSANDVISAIILGAGTNATGYNFAEIDPTAPAWATVEGTVWKDPNRNGVRDVAETAGIAGVTMQLLLPDGTVVATTTTDAAGHYVFAGFPPGDYLIREVQPSGWTSTSPDTIGSLATPVHISTGGLRNMDFFEARGAISGSVFDDRDGDGLQGPDEPGISGVTLTLTGNDADGNPILRTVTTDVSGSYTFGDLPDSDGDGYQIIETQPSGWNDGIDTAGTVDGSTNGIATNDSISGIVITDGAVGDSYLFGETRLSGAPGTTFIAGHVFVDGDGDGNLASGEAGLGGVTIQLLDASGTVVATTVTAPDGSYLFSGIVPGTYSIHEIQPSGYQSTSADDVTDIAVGLEGVADANFGERLPGSGVGAAWISGMVFGDSDGDGIGDPGEPGIAGVTITLTDVFGNVVATTVTGPGGTYRFDGIAPGDYLLVESQPLGLGSTTPNTSATLSVPYTGLSGQNFGESYSSIAGSVFEDLDNDGIQGPGEVGIAGVEIVLTGTDVLGNPVTSTVITDAFGGFVFTGLLAGTYSVAETQPADRADGLDSVGTTGGTLADDLISDISLSSGENATAYGFGENVKAIVTDPGTSWITGIVWNDLDGDGTVDPGEGPLSGVRVELYDADGILVGTAVTGPDGSYVFTGLIPGADYTLNEIDPTGFGSSTPNGPVAVVAPAADTGAVGPSFGDTLGSLSGTVFADTNRDGAMQVGEPGIAGVLVILDGVNALGDPVHLETYTAADGSYQFAGLLAGTYTITETQPAGYEDGAEVAGSLSSDRSKNDVHDAIVLGAGVRATDFGFAEKMIATMTTSISGHVFQDRGTDGLHPDGDYQSSEPGIGGVTIILRDVNGVIVATTVTGPDGSYSFDGVAPGTYSVEALSPIGYGSSTPTVLGALEVPIAGIADADFGFTRSTMSGTVFNDRDGDGIQDPGESGVPGVTITLSGLDSFGNPVLITVTTDADGRFNFVDLPPSGPGGYSITETQPAGWLDGTDHLAVGGVPGADSFGNIIVGSGQALQVGTFAELAGVTVGDRVWEDVNGNGLQDAGEPGMAGIVVTLVGVTATGAPLTRTVTTGADGSFSFGDVPPGSYHLEFAIDGLLATYAHVGSDAGSDSDINSTGKTATFTVVGASTAGATDSDIRNMDAGVARPATVTGVLFTDTNGNGTRDGGEPPTTCSTVTLVIAGPDGVFGTADDGSSADGTVNADGTFSFPTLLPGTYKVTSTCAPDQEVSVKSGEVSPTVAMPVVAPAANAPKGTSPAGALPFTGAEVGRLLIGAMLAVITGAGFVYGVRRRQQPSA